MKAPRLLIAAAAGLLAAGCDYWKNLVDDKEVTRVPLTLVVKDAFTGKPLEKVHCTDPARGIDFTTDNQGAYHYPDAGTGSYDLHCEAPNWYYDRTMRFDVRGEGSSVVVELARHGGAEWYPYEEEEKYWVRISDSLTHIRYPKRFDLKAFPPDSTGKLTYEWSFAKNKIFNRTSTAGKPILSLNARPGNILDGPDTVTLTVKAKLAGRPEYVAGTATLLIEWARNLLPIGTLGANKTVVTVGCDGVPREDTVILDFSGYDPDPGGRCEYVVFESKESTSAFGMFRHQARCNDPDHFRKFGLKNVFPPNQTTVRTAKDSLLVSFIDDNMEQWDTTFRVDIKTNTIPNVTAERLTPGTVFFTYEPITYRISAKDSDGSLSDMYFDWGIGDRSIKNGNLPFPSRAWEDILTYTFTEPGKPLVVGYAADNCREFGSFTPEPVEIRNNSLPEITLAPAAFDYTTDGIFQVQLTVTDKNMTNKLDRFKEILIFWGENEKTDTTSRQWGENILDSTLSHRYAVPPESDGKYNIRVKVTDSHPKGTAAIEYPVPAFRR